MRYIIQYTIEIVKQLVVASVEVETTDELCIIIAKPRSMLGDVELHCDK